MSSFRTSKFDPILIIAQIGSLVILMLELLTGSAITLNHLLYFPEVRIDTVMGWGIFFAYVFNSALGAYFLLIVVQRAKLCLDFAATQHFLHLIVTSLYSRKIPNTFVWWVLSIITLAVMALGGEYLCMQKELEPITLNSQRKREAPDNSFELERLNTTVH